LSTENPKIPPPIGQVRLVYRAKLDPDKDGGLVVIFPDFGVGVTQGETREEALAQAADLLETMVANDMAEGWDLPDPSPAATRRPLVPLVAAKAELYRAMRGAKITEAELARRIGISPQQAHRLFDIHRASRLDRLEAAMRALGRRLIVTSDAA
jgi:antitoxin HicB